MAGNKAKSDDLDKLFDDADDGIDAFMAWDAAHRPGQAARRVNVDFPAWMVGRLDQEARRRGVTRQALIKMWLADRLDSAA